MSIFKEQAPASAAKRCPHCKGAHIHFEEHLTVTHTYVQDEQGQLNPQPSISEPRPDVFEKVKATCQTCHHRWTVHRVCRVQSLPNFPKGAADDH